MKGEMNIKVTEHGYGIDVDLECVSIADKFELLHSVSVALGMNKFDMMLYCHLELEGVLSNATKTTQCEDGEQLDRMLRGELKAKAEDEVEDLKHLFAQLLSKLEERA